MSIQKSIYFSWPLVYDSLAMSELFFTKNEYIIKKKPK